MDDILVYGYADGLGMVVNASNREKIFTWIQSHQNQPAVPVRDTTLETCMIAVQGPKAIGHGAWA